MPPKPITDAPEIGSNPFSQRRKGNAARRRIPFSFNLCKTAWITSTLSPGVRCAREVLQEKRADNFSALTASVTG
jgi:hypothetical protein